VIEPKALNMLTSTFGYKTNMQKPLVAYVYNDLSEKENKKRVQFTIAFKRMK
jgi:hypothetical protein